MTATNIHQAKTQLSKLIERAEAGEDVVIARAGKPVVRLVPIEPPPPEPLVQGRGLFGCMANEIWYAADWEDNAEIIEDFEISIARPLDATDDPR